MISSQEFDLQVSNLLINGTPSFIGLTSDVTFMHGKRKVVSFRDPLSAIVCDWSLYGGDCLSSEEYRAFGRRLVARAHCCVQEELEFALCEEYGLWGGPPLSRYETARMAWRILWILSQTAIPYAQVRFRAKAKDPLDALSLVWTVTAQNEVKV